MTDHPRDLQAAARAGYLSTEARMAARAAADLSTRTIDRELTRDERRQLEHLLRKVDAGNTAAVEAYRADRRTKAATDGLRDLIGAGLLPPNERSTTHG